MVVPTGKRPRATAHILKPARAVLGAAARPDPCGAARRRAAGSGDSAWRCGSRRPQTGRRPRASRGACGAPRRRRETVCASGAKRRRPGAARLVPEEPRGRGSARRAQLVDEHVDHGRVELAAGALAQLADRHPRPQRVAIRAVGGHRVIGVAGEDDPALERDVRAAAAGRGSRPRPSARARDARCATRASGRAARRSSCAPHSGCWRMTSHSARLQRASLRSTASGTPILPTSCSRAAISSSESAASPRPSRSPDPACKAHDLLGMLAGVVVAHLDRRGHRLDPALDRVLELLAHARLVERHGAELGETAQCLQLAPCRSCGRRRWCPP